MPKFSLRNPSTVEGSLDGRENTIDASGTLLESAEASKRGRELGRGTVAVVQPALADQGSDAELGAVSITTQKQTQRAPRSSAVGARKDIYVYLRIAATTSVWEAVAMSIKGLFKQDNFESSDPVDINAEAVHDACEGFDDSMLRDGDEAEQHAADCSDVAEQLSQEGELKAENTGDPRVAVDPNGPATLLESTKARCGSRRAAYWSLSQLFLLIRNLILSWVPGLTGTKPSNCQSATPSMPRLQFTPLIDQRSSVHYLFGDSLPGAQATDARPSPNRGRGSKHDTAGRDETGSVRT